MRVKRMILKRPVEQSLMRSWRCSQIENEVEDESWRASDQMAAKWEEEQKLEEIVEQRRIEGDPLKVKVMRQAPELVVYERMSPGEGVRGPKEKKKSLLKKMKEKPDAEKVEDAEELRKWRCLIQIEKGFTLEVFGCKNGR